MPRQLASHTQWMSLDNNRLQLQLEASSEHLNTPRFAERVNAALNAWMGQELKVEITLVDGELNTPARIDEKIKVDEMNAAHVSINEDPVVKQLIDRVDAAVDPASIQPIGEH